MRKIVLLTIFAIVMIQANGQGTIKVFPGATVKSVGGAWIILNNMHLVNNGTIQQSSGDGIFKFTGAADVTISGSSLTTLGKLFLQKTNGSRIQLQSNLNIVDELNFNGGLLNLNNSVVDLGTTGSLVSESESSRAYTISVGYLQATRMLNAPAAVNPANLGAVISSSQNLGTTVIRRGHQAQTNLPSPFASVLRYFDIAPVNNSLLDATFRFYYFNAEVNGVSEDMLRQWKSPDNSNWTNIGFDSRDTVLNWVEKTGIQDFSRWTLAAPPSVNLPVRFLFFNTVCSSGNVKLNWKTAQEVNSLRFDIEASNTSNWSVIGAVTAAGNSTDVRSYSFADNNSAGHNFYRIVEVDLDGHKTYSPVLKNPCSAKDEFTVWPNPAGNFVNLRIGTTTAARLDIRFYDAKGATVKMMSADLLPGMNQFPVFLENLAPGNYILAATWGSNRQEIKLVKL